MPHLIIHPACSISSLAGSIPMRQQIRLQSLISQMQTRWSTRSQGCHSLRRKRPLMKPRVESTSILGTTKISQAAHASKSTPKLPTLMTHLKDKKRETIRRIKEGKSGMTQTEVKMAKVTTRRTWLVKRLICQGNQDLDLRGPTGETVEQVPPNKLNQTKTASSNLEKILRITAPELKK